LTKSVNGLVSGSGFDQSTGPAALLPTVVTAFGFVATTPGVAVGGSFIPSEPQAELAALKQTPRST
jgi:hypothetical protein